MPSTETRYTTNATGIHATNHTSRCAATMSPTRSDPAPIAAVVSTNMCGSS
jgi:hypothetical protein